MVFLTTSGLALALLCVGLAINAILYTRRQAAARLEAIRRYRECLDEAARIMLLVKPAVPEPQLPAFEASLEHIQQRLNG